MTCRIEKVVEGSSDILVGVSGFGSSWMGGERWAPLARSMGASLYVLHYPAGILPRLEAGPLDYLEGLWRRYRAAERGAQAGVGHLTDWVERWRTQGRRVILIGFSLGGHVACEVARRVPGCTLVTICAAHPVGETAGLEHCAGHVHVYVTVDQVLRYFYPAATRKTATGIAPLAGAINVCGDSLAPSTHLETGRQVPLLGAMGMEIFFGADIRLFAPELPGGSLSNSSLTLLPRGARAVMEVLDYDLMVQAWVQAGCEGVDPRAVAWLEAIMPWAATNDEVLSSLREGYLGQAGERDRTEAIRLLGRARLMALRDGVAPACFTGAVSVSESAGLVRDLEPEGLSLFPLSQDPPAELPPDRGEGE